MFVSACCIVWPPCTLSRGCTQELDSDRSHPGIEEHEINNNQIICIYLLLSAGVEEVEEADNVDVIQSPHDLQLPVLEPLVLENLLNGHHLKQPIRD